MTQTVDVRRITEHDADYRRLHTQTVRRLTRSVRQLVEGLRKGDQGAASAFITRHVDLLYAAYWQAWQEGRTDYWQSVSLRQPPAATPDPATARKRLAFYVTSVAKMAREAQQAWQSVTLDEGVLAQWQDGLDVRIALQADLTWSAFQDGYVDGSNLDKARPYIWVYWVLEPLARHCEQCPIYADNSPYGAPGTGNNELDATPGDGHTDCGAACKCALSYGPGPDDDWADWTGVIPNDMPLDQIWPDVLPPLVVGMPDSPILTDAQKAALDEFRAAWNLWDIYRQQWPDLPEMFDPKSAKYEGSRIAWDVLTEKQQQALYQAMTALKHWQDAGGGKIV